MFFDFGHQRGPEQARRQARLQQRASTRGSTTTSRATERARAAGRRGADPDLPEGRALRRARSTRPTWDALHPGRGPLRARRRRRRPPRPAATRRVGARRSTRSPAAARVRDDARRPTSSGTATYRLPTATGAGLHAAGLADGHRRPRRLPARPSPSSPRGCWTSRPTATRRSSRAASTARRGDGAPGLPAAPERLALRRRPRRQARAAGQRRALRAGVERAFTVASSLELRLPVRERPGAQVRRPLAPVPGR